MISVEYSDDSGIHHRLRQAGDEPAIVRNVAYHRVSDDVIVFVVICKGERIASTNLRTA
jgi:hypothetical protein